MPKYVPKCIACEGSGKNSKGGKCHPCNGTGRKLPQQGIVDAKAKAKTL